MKQCKVNLNKERKGNYWLGNLVVCKINLVRYIGARQGMKIGIWGICYNCVVFLLPKQLHREASLSFHCALSQGIYITLNFYSKNKSYLLFVPSHRKYKEDNFCLELALENKCVLHFSSKVIHLIFLMSEISYVQQKRSICTKTHNNYYQQCHGEVPNIAKVDDNSLQRYFNSP